MKRSFFALVLGLMLCFLVPQPVHTCVGRLLIVAVSNSTDQVIMGRMLSVLINERTGTTVNIVQPGDLETCHQAVLDGKADIYIDYIGMGRARTGMSSTINDPQEVYTLVRQSFMEKFGMVWLKPFGFGGPLTPEANLKKSGRTLAAPVATKDVLRRFPVLDRLINKLGGRVDNNTIDELRGKTVGQDIQEAVKGFLKSKSLI